ncbi:hypothetical protein pb186bvf_013779 [Paramecium bursaria]
MNKLIQRYEFMQAQKNDILQQMQGKEIDQAIQGYLQMSIIDSNETQLFLRQNINQSKHKNKPKKVYEQVQRYLKETYHMECYSLQSKKALKPIIKNGELCDMNLNWVLFELSGGRVMKLQNPGVYNKLLNLKSKYPKEFFEPINLDVVRTIQGQEKASQTEAIRNLLTAYSIRNPQLGYCQGQNFIANFIVNTLKFDELDAFWIYTAIIETIMPLDYYTNILSAMVDQRILQFYLERYLPEVDKHFKQIGISTDYFSLQWYLCIFTNQTNPKLTSYIFLMLVLDGIKSLTISTLIILTMIKEEILKFKQFTEAISYMNTFVERFSDIEAFRFFYNQIKLKKKEFNYARESIRQQMREQQKPIELNKKQLLDINSVQCNSIQPICSQLQLMNQLMRRSDSFFVFRSDELKIIQDYSFKSEPTEVEALIDGLEYQEVQRDQPIRIDEKKLKFKSLKEQIVEQERIEQSLRPEVTRVVKKKQTKPNIYEKTKPLTDDEEVIEESGFKQEIFNEEDFDYFQYYGQLREIDDKKLKLEREHIRIFKSKRQELIIDNTPQIVVYKDKQNPLLKTTKVSVIKFNKKFLEDDTVEDKKEVEEKQPNKLNLIDDSDQEPAKKKIIKLVNYD